MSAYAAGDKVVDAILSQQYGLIVANFANMDMVGHTGNFKAAGRAAGVVDRCLSDFALAVDRVHGTALIPADHGNAEQTWDFENEVPHTQHTMNPIPLVLYGEKYGAISLKSGGKLGDLAPTFLHIMDLKQPAEMIGQSLINC
jgi:2,3-bisphosphoglycerate-independent phosphoglycerate mutase